MSLHSILIVKDPEIAAYAHLAGVDRLMIDLESMGKKERQKSLNAAHFGGATWEDLTAIRYAVPNAALIVRVNPYGEHSAFEIEQAIHLGANYLMLPMFKDTETIQQFLSIVDGRVPVIPLLETAEALLYVSEISTLSGIDYIHIGFNDLHLSLNQRFLFEPLAYGVMDTLAGIFKHAHMEFGMGGIGRIATNDINTVLDPYLVLSEHIRLNSSWVILSQAFCGGVQTNLTEMKSKIDLPSELNKLKEASLALENLPLSDIEINKNKLRDIVFKIASKK